MKHETPADDVERRARRRADWGGVARKGAKTIAVDDYYVGHEPEGVPDVEPSSKPSGANRRKPPSARSTGGRSSAAAARPKKSKRTRQPAPPSVTVDDAALASVPPPARARARQQLTQAARHFASERFDDARQTLKPLLREHPGVVEAVELEGLCCYRLERWKGAIDALERFVELTSSTEQHPVLADAYRALGNYARVAELWDELRASDVAAPTMAEGRIVAASALAEAGNLPAAISLLAKGPTKARRLAHHHLRMIYALADLYERAGDTQRARRGFERVSEADPELFDAKRRLSTLDMP